MHATDPTIDLSAFEQAKGAERREIAASVDRICRDTGFLALTGHGVAPGVIAELWTETETFFDQPPEDKAKSSAPYPGYPYGYLGPGAEALAKSTGVETPPDLKESFNGGPLSVPPGLTDPDALVFCYAETIWPADRPGFRPAWVAYYAAMEDLARRIMRLFAAALGLGEEAFETAIDKPISALRALNYPAQTAPPAPGQLRAGAHSDYGSLTILSPEGGAPGLEILGGDGAWRPAPSVPGGFIVNIGDLMARWTNDRWVSTLHRVANSSAGRRRSMAFFHQPNWEFEVRCLPTCLAEGEEPRYPPVRSGPYLMSKFQSTVG